VPGHDTASGGGGGGGHWFPSLDFDLAGDGFSVCSILLAALILGIVLRGRAKLVYAAPQIRPAARGVALAGALRGSTEEGELVPGVLRSSAIPCIVVLIGAGAGFAAHHDCPTAAQLLQVFSCPAEADSHSRVLATKWIAGPEFATYVARSLARVAIRRTQTNCRRRAQVCSRLEKGDGSTP